MKRFILKTPMAIFTEEDTTLPCFIFPKGASLYYDTGFSEGFSRYIMYVNISDSYTNDKNILEFNQEDIISPIWLNKIDKDTLEYIMNSFPLSKEDLTQIIKQNGITKDDLADIIRNMENDITLDNRIK